MTTDDVVARAKAALEGVTYGPWEYDTQGAMAAYDSEVVSPAIWLGDGDLGFLVENHYQADENGRFVAASRSLVPELVAEVERLRTELAFARDGMEIRPMTAVESNLMTQVLDLRRQLAEAKAS